MTTVPPDPARLPEAPGDAPRHRALLNELAELGMDMARLLHARAHQEAHQQAHRQAQDQAQDQAPARAHPPAADRAEPPPGTPRPDPFAAFDRIARCVRRTVLLADHLARPHPARPHPASPHPASPDASGHPAPGDDPAVTARRHLLRAIENTIAEHLPPGPRADALHREAIERLDGLDVVEDLRTRPARKVATELCDDLQVYGPDTRRRTPADVSRLLARARGETLPEPPTRPAAGPPAWVHRSEPRRTRPAPPPGPPPEPRPEPLAGPPPGPPPGPSWDNDPDIALLQRLARRQA